MKHDSKDREDLIAAVTCVHEVFARADEDENECDTGHSLAISMLADATKEGAKKGTVKRLYRAGSPADRRGAIAFLNTLMYIVPQLLDVMTEISSAEEDGNCKTVCTCGECEGDDVIHPDPLADMPDELRAAIEGLIADSGLTVKSVGDVGNSGFIELVGNAADMEKAHDVLQKLGALGPHGGLPASLKALIDKEPSVPTDTHTDEISKALDRMGRSRPKLGKKNFPFS